jgi:hypothetical protein
VTFYNNTAAGFIAAKALEDAADTVLRELNIVWPFDRFVDVRRAAEYAAEVLRSDARKARGEVGALRKRRAELGLTILQAARATSIAPSQISYMERGERSTNTDIGRRYMEFLGMES